MNRLVGVVVLGCVAAFLVSGVFAGEDQAPEKDINEMSVDELRTYQGFYYASGGRDPLTMRKPTVEELGFGEKKNARERVAPTLEEMELHLTQALAAAREALKKQDYVEAIAVTEEAISVIDNEWPPIKSDLVNLIQMDEELRGYNRLAVRLKTQEDVTAEFAALHLKVDGVIWSPIEAKAVVNGVLLSAGEIMLAERKQGDLRVEIVEEHGVVFQFKGMRFRLPVDLYAQ